MGIVFTLATHEDVGLYVAFGSAFFFGLGWVQGKDSARVRRDIQLESSVAEVVDELVWMEGSKELLDRTHPGLVPLLERATLACDEIEREMKNVEWQRKAKKEPWKSVQEGCLQTAEEGWGDVVWIGRHLFRRKGWRKTTFERNVADPEFGARSFHAVEEVVEALESLAANVKGEDETNQSVIDRTRARLAELRAAESELGEGREFLRE